jgi:hypothetical protein
MPEMRPGLIVAGPVRANAQKCRAAKVAESPKKF